MAELISDFLNFILEANSLTRVSQPLTTVDHFERFIADARLTLTTQKAAIPIEEFEAFVFAATPLFLSQIMDYLAPLAERAKMAKNWIVQHDLLKVAGYSRLENPYTELMRWALDPDTDPSSALQRQVAWLGALGVDVSACGKKACRPKTQLYTDDGIIDLILPFENLWVIVEAKTGSIEHAAPSGSPQTIAYRTVLESKSNKVEVVFITPDGCTAADTRARNTTYSEFVFALLPVIAELPACDTREAFKMLFTHFLNYATEQPLTELISKITAWSGEPDWTNTAALFNRRNEILDAVKLLLPDTRR